MKHTEQRHKSNSYATLTPLVDTFEFNPDQTRATRVAIGSFLTKMGAQLWIQHDVNGNAKLKKSPQFYE